MRRKKKALLVLALIVAVPAGTFGLEILVQRMCKSSLNETIRSICS